MFKTIAAIRAARHARRKYELAVLDSLIRENRARMKESADSKLCRFCEAMEPPDQREVCEAQFGGWTKTMLVTIAVLAALLGVTSGTAEARPTTRTGQVHAPTHEVNQRAVTSAKVFQIEEGMKGVRFKMNDGSIWVSPDRRCLGLRHRGCKIAWQRALGSGA